MDWGLVGRAGTGRRPRGTKGLAVATVGPQPQAPGGPGGEVTRGQGLSRERWEPQSGPAVSVPIHLSSHLSQRLAQKEEEPQPGSRVEGEGGLTSPNVPSPGLLVSPPRLLPHLQAPL